MGFFCKQIRKKESEDVVYELVNKSLNNKNYFNLITKFIYNAIHVSSYENVKLIISEEYDFPLEIESLLDDFYDGNRDKISLRRGEFVELLIFRGLYRNNKVNKMRECKPGFGGELLNIQYKGKRLNKDFDVAFWKDSNWAELYECKVNMYSILNDAEKWDKLIFMNEIYFHLEEKVNEIKVFLGDIGTVDKLNDKLNVFSSVLNKKLKEVVMKSINGIFRYQFYCEKVKLNFFNRSSLERRIFA